MREMHECLSVFAECKIGSVTGLGKVKERIILKTLYLIS